MKHTTNFGRYILDVGIPTNPGNINTVMNEHGFKHGICGDKDIYTFENKKKTGSKIKAVYMPEVKAGDLIHKCGIVSSKLILSIDNLGANDFDRQKIMLVAQKLSDRYNGFVYNPLSGFREMY